MKISSRKPPKMLSPAVISPLLPARTCSTSINPMVSFYLSLFFCPWGLSAAKFQFFRYISISRVKFDEDDLFSCLLRFDGSYENVYGLDLIFRKQKSIINVWNKALWVWFWIDFAYQTFRWSERLRNIERECSVLTVS